MALTLSCKGCGVDLINLTTHVQGFTDVIVPNWLRLLMYVRTHIGFEHSDYLCCQLIHVKVFTNNQHI